MNKPNPKDQMVSISTGEIKLQTYPLQGENRNPVFHSQYGVAHIYPYTLQDEISNRPEEITYRTLLLENEYLIVTVLPDLGGRVYSLFDKLADREVFYKNPTIKFSPLAIRGAFFSGGLEFSFPVAHAPTTADPVNCHIWQAEDGSASIMIGGIEHMSGMRWTIKLTLFPNQCALAQDVFLYNPTPVPGRYHYWTNASLASDENTEFIYPLHRARSYEYAGTSSWPITRLDLITDQPGLPGMEGVPMWPANRLQSPLNLRWEKDMLAQVSVFGRNVIWDYFGAWQHSTNTGYAHFAKYQDVSGMKLWSWGKSEVGVVNQSALMDDGTLYAETQCGAMETQLDFDFLAPGKTKSWREWWLPLRDLGGLTCASDKAGARIQMLPGEDESQVALEIGICPISRLENASLELSIPGRVLLSEAKLSASPRTPWLKTVLVEALVLADHPITLRLEDQTGSSLLDYTHSRETDPISAAENRENDQQSTAEDFYQLGLKHQNYDNRAQALESYREALALDPDHSSSHLQWGLMLLRSADFEGAQEHLLQVRGDKKSEAQYYLGLISWYLNDPGQAKTHFQAVPAESQLGIPALRGQVAATYREQDWKESDRLLRTTTPPAEFVDLHQLLKAITARTQGSGEAASLLADLVAADPLNLVALRELSLVQEDPSANPIPILKRLLADDPQYILDLAAFYLDNGLLADALAVLIDLGGDWSYPLRFYLAGEICELMGQEKQASSWRSKGQDCNPDLVFPSRLWEINALRSALKKNPEDHKAQYYLGVFYYAFQRYDEALDLWQNSLQGLADYDVLFRNLGLAAWQQKNDLPSATQAFEKALGLNPKNQDLYLLLDDLYREQNLDQKRSELLASIQNLSPLREDLRKRSLATLLDLGQVDQVLKILDEEKFVPLEMDQSFHLLYVKALILKAEELALSGKIEDAIMTLRGALDYPDHHGVGRPTTEGNAEILFRLGLLYEQTGNYKAALLSWTNAASEHHSFSDPLFEFIQKSLDKLGRYSELGFEYQT